MIGWRWRWIYRIRTPWYEKKWPIPSRQLVPGWGRGGPGHEATQLTRSTSWGRGPGRGWPWTSDRLSSWRLREWDLGQRRTSGRSWWSRLLPGIGWRRWGWRRTPGPGWPWCTSSVACRQGIGRPCTWSGPRGHRPASRWPSGRRCWELRLRRCTGHWGCSWPGRPGL